MRVKISLAAAVLLLGGGAVSLWTNSNAGTWMGAATAQEPKPVEGTKSTQPPVTTLEERLNQRVDVDFVETNLKDAVQYLQGITGIQFVLKAKKLDEAGVRADATVTKTLKQVRLATALDLILEDLELVYVEKDELLVITTPEDAESRLLIRVYDCRDLLAFGPPDLEKKPIAAAGGSKSPSVLVPPADAAPTLAPPSGSVIPVPPTRFPPANRPALPQFGGAAGAVDASSKESKAEPGASGGHNAQDKQPPRTEYENRIESLIELLETTVEPQAWDTVGGVGSITSYNGLVVVSQTAHTHKQVQQTLDMLREAAGLQGPGKVVR